MERIAYRWAYASLFKGIKCLAYFELNLSWKTFGSIGLKIFLKSDQYRAKHMMAHERMVVYLWLHALPCDVTSEVMLPLCLPPEVLLLCAQGGGAGHVGTPTSGPDEKDKDSHPTRSHHEAGVWAAHPWAAGGSFGGLRVQSEEGHRWDTIT